MLSFWTRHVVANKHFLCIFYISGYIVFSGVRRCNGAQVDMDFTMNFLQIRANTISDLSQAG